MHERASAAVSAWPRARRRSKLFILMICICAMALALSGSALTTISAYADSQPGGNVADPVVRAVDIARPAVVRIITTIGGHLSVQENGKSVTFPQSSAVTATPATPTPETSSSSNGYQVQFSGSGTFISSQGDILTADHVVNPPRDQALSQAFYQKAAPDIAASMNQGSGSGTQVTADQVNQQLTSGALKSTLTIDNTSSEVFLSTDYSGPLTNTDFSALPASLRAPVDKIEKESASDQADVAIIHAPFTNTPSVQLDDSSTVQAMDELTIIGFPGNGDVNPTNPGDFLTSSINKISVSSIKTASSGAKVIQVGGNVEQGDSGGPALDKNGAVVGIVSFGLTSSSNTGSSGGTSFLQASNSAKTLLQSLNLDTTPGSFQKAWSQAFNDYAATTPGHWHKAQQELQQLLTAYPQFKAITPYLNYAQQQARSETVAPTQPTQAKSLPGATRPTSPSLFAGIPQTIWITAGAVAVLVLLVILLFVVSIRRRGRKKGQGRSENKPEPPQATPQSAAPPGASTPPASPPSGTFTTLRVWPCGHMNRPNARFCSICGEPAPERPTRP